MPNFIYILSSLGQHIITTIKKVKIMKRLILLFVFIGIVLISGCTRDEKKPDPATYSHPVYHTNIWQ